MVSCSKKTVIGGLIFLTSLLLCYISWVCWIGSEDPNSNLEFLYRIPYPIIQKSENTVNISAENIAIVMILEEEANKNDYKVSIESVECYAKAHGYQFVLTRDNNWGCDYLLDVFFRRNCIIAKILPRYEAVLHLDPDIGVVNPKRKLEDFLDEKYDITFYEEVSTGSFFVRNTTYALNLLSDFANFGTDFGKVRILKKGTGPMRDGWLTNGMWSPERDFMLHGRKMNHLDPFLGDFHMNKCVLGNTTWFHNKKLITTKAAIEQELWNNQVEVTMKKIEQVVGLSDLPLKCKLSDGEGVLTKNFPAKMSKLVHFATLRVLCVQRFRAYMLLKIKITKF